MPKTFPVFFLGQLPVWDPIEGDQLLSTGAVDQALGVYGSAADPLFDDIQTLSSDGNGFAGGNATAYDLDNNASNDQFSLDGGPIQTHDASMVFNAVITFKTGDTANITAVVFQDTNGNTYWGPEFSNNADQAAIESAAIQSLQLVSPIYAQGNFGQGFNLTADRIDSELIYIARGARIACPSGERPIEALEVGDLVETMDHGPRPIRWIGRRTVLAVGDFAPIRFEAGAYGAKAALEVSPQHRMFMSSSLLELTCGVHEALSAAKHLINGRDVTRRTGGEVEYFHLLFDDHEIIWANGAATESLFLGDASPKAIDPGGLAEIHALFPELPGNGVGRSSTARPVLKAFEARMIAKVLATRSPDRPVRLAS